MAPFCFYNPRDMYDGEYLKIFQPIDEVETPLGTLYLGSRAVAYLSTGIGNRKTFSIGPAKNEWEKSYARIFLLTKRGAARMSKDDVHIDGARLAMHRLALNPDALKADVYRPAVVIHSEGDLEEHLHQGYFCPKCERSLEETLVAFVQEVSPYHAAIDAKRKRIQVKRSRAQREAIQPNAHNPGYPAFQPYGKELVRMACWRCGTDVTDYIGQMETYFNEKS